MSFEIRLAASADSEELLRIYAPYVSETAVSFETRVPSVEEFAARITTINRCYPYLVCIADGNIVGYAYAASHRERAAYAYDVDLSIYVAPSYHGTGAARGLYTCLFALLKQLGYFTAYAAYTSPNEKSARFHEKFGFRPIGTHCKTGYKFGKWHDVVWLEKSIQEHYGEPQTVRMISELSPAQLLGCFSAVIF